MAFSLEANVYLATYGIWTDAGGRRAPRGWVHGRYAAIAEPVAGGASTSATPTSPAGPTGSWRPRNLDAPARHLPAVTPTAVFVSHLGLSR